MVFLQPQRIDHCKEDNLILPVICPKYIYNQPSSLIVTGPPLRVFCSNLIIERFPRYMTYVSNSFSANSNLTRLFNHSFGTTAVRPSPGTCLKCVLQVKLLISDTLYNKLGVYKNLFYQSQFIITMKFCQEYIICTFFGNIFHFITRIPILSDIVK